MSKTIHGLLPLFEELRAQSSPLVWAIVARTSGATYAKAGAQLLIAPDGRYAGLLSGGCLEGDLAEHAREALRSGDARKVCYDMRTPDDLLFGLGSGCEGAMDILLMRLDAKRDWQPLTGLAAAWRARRSEELLLAIDSSHPTLPAGGGLFPRGSRIFGGELTATEIAAIHRGMNGWANEDGGHLLTGLLPGVEILRLRQAPPLPVLVLGAGPDAQPVVTLAAQLGWSVTVMDHRTHYAQVERFPGAAAVMNGGADAAAAILDGTKPFSAAVIMSHHFTSDLAYLRALARSEVPYIGLLGPVVRRERLLSALGTDAGRLGSRLHAPVGLDLGADTAEAIALSIVAEIHAVLVGRPSANRVRSA